ncbi:MAG: hypothetical protein MR821_10030, partial [Clostridiales bacterium]|nr:hypothetical protein [Clostridiales bacterium]
PNLLEGFHPSNSLLRFALIFELLSASQYKPFADGAGRLHGVPALLGAPLYKTGKLEYDGRQAGKVCPQTGEF